MWQAIDWKGKYNSQRDSSPTDEAFKQHFESLLNGNRQPDTNDIAAITQNSPYIPVLDDAFNVCEL